MAAVQETVDRVRRIDVDQYRYGFETLIEFRQGPQGAVGRYRPLHLGEKERTGLDAGMAPGGVSPLADHDRAEMGPGRLSQDRLPGSLLLLGAEAEEDHRLARRDRPGNPRDLQEARHSLARGRGAGRRRASGRRTPHRGRCRVQFGVGGHHVPEGAEAGRRDLHADLGGDPRASRTGAEVSRHRGADFGQLSSRR